MRSTCEYPCVLHLEPNELVAEVIVTTPQGDLLGVLHRPEEIP